MIAVAPAAKTPTGASRYHIQVGYSCHRVEGMMLMITMAALHIATRRTLGVVILVRPFAMCRELHARWVTARLAGVRVA